MQEKPSARNGYHGASFTVYEKYRFFGCPYCGRVLSFERSAQSIPNTVCYCRCCAGVIKDPVQMTELFPKPPVSPFQ